MSGHITRTFPASACKQLRIRKKLLLSATAFCKRDHIAKEMESAVPRGSGRLQTASCRDGCFPQAMQVTVRIGRCRLFCHLEDSFRPHARLETVHLKALYRFQEYSFHGMRLHGRTLDRSDLDGNGIACDVPRRHMLFMSAAGHMGHKLLTDSQCLIADHGLLSQRIELYPVYSFCAYACIAQHRIDRERMPSFSGGSNAMLLIS